MQSRVTPSSIWTLTVGTRFLLLNQLTGKLKLAHVSIIRISLDETSQDLPEPSVSSDKDVNSAIEVLKLYASRNPSLLGSIISTESVFMDIFLKGVATYFINL
ncbi:hypothetical protein LOD99_13298 [Oopsacas minuta]|uniref:Uncharacterized protein n=1 Tax=Oopsacas minuta TaxID=111878 RepID=A0AAV7KKF9_9METZ|nr:hypothetical protein LOD99_13298 [Oopsacas minuta]